MNNSPVVVIKCQLDRLSAKCWFPLPEETPKQVFFSYSDQGHEWQSHFSDILEELEKRGYRERSMTYDADRDQVVYVFVLQRTPA